MYKGADYIYIYTYIHTYIHTYIYALFIFIFMFMFMFVFIHLFRYLLFISVFISLSIHLFIPDRSQALLIVRRPPQQSGACSLQAGFGFTCNHTDGRLSSSLKLQSSISCHHRITASSAWQSKQRR